jgi:K+-transporting ATPase KdpF subunit
VDVRGGALVISIDVVAGVLSLLVGIYLLIALLLPERF